VEYYDIALRDGVIPQHFVQRRQSEWNWVVWPEHAARSDTGVNRSRRRVNADAVTGHDSKAMLFYKDDS
jgi:hypothetical protein